KPDAQSAGAAPEVGADAIATGMMLASFDWVEYRGKDTRKKHERESIAFTLVFPDAELKQARESARRDVPSDEGQNVARTIASRPGNEINPPALADVAQKFAKEVGLKCRVLDDKEMKRLGMGGILAVGAGSNRTPPRMIVLEWQGQGPR